MWRYVRTNTQPPAAAAFAGKVLIGIANTTASPFEPARSMAQSGRALQDRVLADDVPKILGRPAGSFGRFVIDHAVAFSRS